jgi:hypothetical protein
MDHCVAGSICFEMLKGVPAAFVTLIIGSIAARITYNQFLVAKAKLKLDLFEQRYKIFQGVWDILFIIATESGKAAHVKTGEKHVIFLDGGFLFGDEVVGYLKEISDKWAELRVLETDGVGKETRLKELENWFREQTVEGAKLKFDSYLDFKNWK